MSARRTPNPNHRNTAARIRLAVGIWLLALAAYLCYRGIWWGLLLLVPAALHFYLAYRSHRSVQNYQRVTTVSVAVCRTRKPSSS